MVDSRREVWSEQGLVRCVFGVEAASIQTIIVYELLCRSRPIGVGTINR